LRIKRSRRRSLRHDFEDAMDIEDSQRGGILQAEITPLASQAAIQQMPFCNG
jgi:hypothetical protein